MVHVDYTLCPDEFSLTVSGHAGYAAKGSDVVCAGVSALTLALCRYIEANISLSQAGLFIKRVSDGFVLLAVADVADSELRKGLYAAFSVCVAGLLGISAQYPENVAVRDITSLTGLSDIDAPEQTEKYGEGRTKE